MSSKTVFLAVVAVLFVAFFFSCKTIEPPVVDAKPFLQMPIMGKGKKDAETLLAFFMSQNPDCDKERVARLAKIYVDEATAEGVNSDVAFVQMCHETGYLRFGNLVKSEMNNFCGLGAIDVQNPGLSFSTERDGIRAHIQHLKAYASVDPLIFPLVDPRYKYVNPKGKSPNISGLAGTWAADKQYGEKLAKHLATLAAM